MCHGYGQPNKAFRCESPERRRALRNRESERLGVRTKEKAASSVGGLGRGLRRSGREILDFKGVVVIEGITDPARLLQSEARHWARRYMHTSRMGIVFVLSSLSML